MAELKNLFKTQVMLLRSVDKRLEKIEKRNRYVNFLGNGMTDKEDESTSEQRDLDMASLIKYIPSKTYEDLDQLNFLLCNKIGRAHV